LYEDQNDTYDYEKGAFATIRFDWDDAKKTLTIGDRQGNFPGMLAARTFHVVFVGDGHGTAIDPTATPDKVVKYSGQRVTVTQ
jgi:alpha-D-xyloside xylohydrolase